MLRVPRAFGKKSARLKAARFAVTAILGGCAGAQEAPPPCGPLAKGAGIQRTLSWQAPGRVPSSVPMAVNIGSDRVLVTWVTRKEIPAADNRFLSEVWLAVVGPESESIQATPVLTFRSYETHVSLLEASPPLLVVAHSWQLECFEIGLPGDGGQAVISPLLAVPSAEPRTIHAATRNGTLCIAQSTGNHSASLLACRRSSAGLEHLWLSDLSRRELPHAVPSSVIPFGDEFLVTLTSWDSEWDRFQREVLSVDGQTGLVRRRWLLESGSLDAMQADFRGSRLPFDEDSISTAAGPNMILVACLSVRPSTSQQAWLYEIDPEVESAVSSPMPTEAVPAESLELCVLSSNAEIRLVVAGTTDVGTCSTRIMVKHGETWTSRPVEMGPASVGRGPGLGLTVEGSRLLFAWSDCASGQARVELLFSRIN